MIFMMRSLLLCLALFFSAAAVSAAPLQVGVGKIECPNGTEPITVFTYKPPTFREGPLIVVCHGVSRNAEDYRNYAITMAERFGAIVVTPLFDAQRFPSARYQRGGLVGADGKAQPSEAWTYAVIPKIVAHVRTLENKTAATMPYYLIGHSAGGQFLVRLAAFLPGDAVRIVAANPGSDLFPTRDQDFGYGFGGLPAELNNDEVIRRYLAVPLTYYLGTDDIYPRPSFDDSERDDPTVHQRSITILVGRSVVWCQFSWLTMKFHMTLVLAKFGM